MKVEHIYEFSELDKELLKNPLPHDPCHNCPDISYCCGCPEGSEYVHQIKPYKDAGIYDIASKIRYILDMQSEIESHEKEIIRLQAEFEKAKNSLPPQVLELLHF